VPAAALFSQILSVLAVLVQRYSQGLLTRPQLLQLQQAVVDLPAWLWCYNRQCWVGLDQEPAAADDAEIAAVMSDVPGVHLVQLDGPLPGGQSNTIGKFSVFISMMVMWQQ
jgi:hypothetical protein